MLKRLKKRHADHSNGFIVQTFGLSMRRLVRDFADRLCDLYTNLVYWFICALSDFCVFHNRKTFVKWPLTKRKIIDFRDQLSFIEGHKYCRMNLQYFLTFINLPFVIKIFVLSIFEWPFHTGFTVLLSK